MDYISTTDLRNKTSKLKDSLKSGESVYLIHRSKVIGVVEPYNSNDNIFSVSQLLRLRKVLPSSKKHYSYKQREDIYSKHLRAKYGKSIS